jgi:ABC-type lipoprotein release transport system permease subunit
MRIFKLAKLMLKNVVRSRRTLFFSSIGVVVGIATFIFFLSLGQGLEHLLRTKVFPTLPPNEIEVIPEVFATGRAEDLGKGYLTDADIERIRGMPKVTAVHGRVDSTVPATAYITADEAQRYRPGWRGIALDLIVDGIHPELVQQDRDFYGKRERFVDAGDDPGKPVPVIISNHLYNLYAMSAAPSLKIPVFPKEMIVGFRFHIRLGQGIFRGRSKMGEVRERYGEVVGFSNYGNRAGVTVPAQYLEFVNREYQGAEAARRFKSLIVTTASPEDKVELTRALREVKFRPEVDHQAEMVVQIVTTITLILSIVSFVIVVISAIHIMHTFFMLIYERKTEIGLMRSLGATRGDVRSLIVGEAFFLGLISGAFGVLVGFLFTRVCDWAVIYLAPSFSQFRGESFFAFPAEVIFGAIGFAAVFCALGATLPARQAARMEPAHALAVQ